MSIVLAKERSSSRRHHFHAGYGEAFILKSAEDAAH